MAYEGMSSCRTLGRTLYLALAVRVGMTALVARDEAACLSAKLALAPLDSWVPWWRHHEDILGGEHACKLIIVDLSVAILIDVVHQRVCRRLRDRTVDRSCVVVHVFEQVEVLKHGLNLVARKVAVAFGVDHAKSSSDIFVLDEQLLLDGTLRVLKLLCGRPAVAHHHVVRLLLLRLHSLVWYECEQLDDVLAQYHLREFIVVNLAIAVVVAQVDNTVNDLWVHLAVPALGRVQVVADLLGANLARVVAIHVAEGDGHEMRTRVCAQQQNFLEGTERLLELIRTHTVVLQEVGLHLLFRLHLGELSHKVIRVCASVSKRL
mmetsp:Transcript_19491/g.49770  ORF Transcript_19491/g.49770 Transcript_19491/m.49770 type:complete len:320 (-) Transcript_19491:437-1396(-)